MPDPEVIVYRATEMFRENGIFDPELYFYKGKCLYFADMMMKLYPGSELFSSTDHVMIKIPYEYGDYLWDIRGCHGPVERNPEYRLDYKEDLIILMESGDKAVID